MDADPEGIPLVALRLPLAMALAWSSVALPSRVRPMPVFGLSGGGGVLAGEVQLHGERLPRSRMQHM